jgi:hypothetical protein
MAPCPHQVKLDATFRVIRNFCDLRQLLFVVPRGFADIRGQPVVLQM